MANSKGAEKWAMTQERMLLFFFHKNFSAQENKNDWGWEKAVNPLSLEELN